VLAQGEEGGEAVGVCVSAGKVGLVGGEQLVEYF